MSVSTSFRGAGRPISHIRFLLVQEGRKELAGAIDFVRGLLASRLGKHERKARKRWKRFKAVKLPR